MTGEFIYTCSFTKDFASQKFFCVSFRRICEMKGISLNKMSIMYDDDALCIHAHTHSGSATAPSK